MTPKAFIWDLDGTIFNTSFEMTEVGNRCLREIGLPELPLESYTHYSGLGNGGFFKGLLRDAGGEEAVHLWKKFDDIYTPYEAEAAKTDIMFPFDGVIDVLKEMHNRGFKLAIYSNKGQDACTGAIDLHLGENYFDLIQGYEPGLISKPDPSGGFLICKKLGLKPEECVYIGDTEIDMEAGHNVGFYTIAALWGYRTKEHLMKWNPDGFAEKPEDLLDMGLYQSKMGCQN